MLLIEPVRIPQQENQNVNATLKMKELVTQ